MNITCNYILILKYAMYFLVFFWAKNICSQQSICFGSTKIYSVDTDENSGLGTTGSIYMWNIIGEKFQGEILYLNNNTTNTITINWRETPPGNYTIEVIETKDTCNGAKQKLDITILPTPSLNLTDQYLCEDPLTHQIINTTVLDTKLSTLQYSFKWYFEGEELPFTSSEISTNQPGNYTVEITNIDTGCKTNDSATIAISSSAIGYVKVENDFDAVQKISIIITNGIGDYEYSINNSIFQDKPEFLVWKSDVYKITIRDKNGCTNQSLEAVVLTFPKFFTPNSDGLNDTWNISGALPYMNPIISIYDRYGVLITKLDINDKGWDGTKNGTTLPSNDYWFVIDYLNRDKKPSIYKSHFSLKR